MWHQSRAITLLQIPKMTGTCNNPNLDLVNINAYTKYGQILLIRSLLRGNEILNKFLTSAKGHNSISNVQKMMCCNHNLDLVNINTHTNFGQTLSIRLKIMSGNENLTLIKGHYSVTNMWKMTVNNPNLLDLVNINAHTKFGQILSTRSQDIEQKQNSDMTSVKGHNSITKVQKNDMQKSQPWSCQYQCIYKIKWNSIHLFSRYWMEMKFWRQSRAITL